MRVFDSVHKMSMGSASGGQGSASIPADLIDAVAELRDTFTAWTFFYIKAPTEQFYSSYPSPGINKLDVGVVGWTTQMSGGPGISKGTMHFRLDANSVQNTANPTSLGGNMFGALYGWNFYAISASEGIQQAYLNNLKAVQRTYTHEPGGINAVGTQMVLRFGYGYGVGGLIHPGSALSWGLHSVVLTPEEIFKIYQTRKAVISRGLVASYEVDENTLITGNMIDQTGNKRNSGSFSVPRFSLEVPV